MRSGNNFLVFFLLLVLSGVGFRNCAKSTYIGITYTNSESMCLGVPIIGNTYGWALELGSVPSLVMVGPNTTNTP